MWLTAWQFLYYETCFLLQLLPSCSKLSEQQVHPKLVWGQLASLTSG